MKLKVTQPRCNRMEVGAVFEVEDDVIPAWAVGKVEIIEEEVKEAKPEKVAVTNPAKPAAAPNAVAKEAAPVAPVADGAQAAAPANAGQAAQAGAPANAGQAAEAGK